MSCKKTDGKNKSKHHEKKKKNEESVHDCTGQEAVQLKSPISLKLGTNVASDKLTIVTKYKVKIVYSFRDMALSAKLAIFD